LASAYEPVGRAIAYALTGGYVLADDPEETRALRREGGGMSAEGLGLSIEEACEALGVGRTFFYEMVYPELKLVRRRRRVACRSTSSSAGWIEMEP
jgi:hypothetical protein